MGWLFELYRIALDVVEARIPFRLLTSIFGDPPTIGILITNHTKDIPIVIQQCRIHFGSRDYTYSFVLSPEGTQTIGPRNSMKFFIPFNTARVQRRITGDVRITSGDTFPSFDSPADLFRAIANGPRKHSWIEIDFNEFRQRRFRRGRMKRLFVEALKLGKERHKNRMVCL